MNAIRLLSVMAFLAMSAILVFGFVSGDFSEEGSSVWALAWGKVTIVDLYVGLAFFGAWIAVRERRLISTALWWLVLIFLGNLAAAIYLVRAAFTSSDLSELLIGSNGSPRTRDSGGSDQPR